MLVVFVLCCCYRDVASLMGDKLFPSKGLLKINYLHFSKPQVDATEVALISSIFHERPKTKQIINHIQQILALLHSHIFTTNN